MTVSKTAVIQYLEHRVEYLRMRLLDLVEKHYRIRMSSYCFGKLAAFIVADISRRRTDESRDVVLFHIFGHIDPYKRGLVTEHDFGKGFRKLRLTDTRRAKENE